MASAPSAKSSDEVSVRSRGTWNVVVVTADPMARHELQQALSRLDIDASWLSTVHECSKISRRDMIDMVFLDERVPDGDYWDVYGAITKGLIRKPKFVLLSRSMTRGESEQAERSGIAERGGIFAVLERPCRPATIEWAVILAKRSTRNAERVAHSTVVPKFDIFVGAPDKNAVWVCGVAGLANARETMEHIAAEKPGRYFIFYAPDRNVLSQIETFPTPARRPESKPAS